MLYGLQGTFMRYKYQYVDFHNEHMVLLMTRQI